jgi:hypothetical protein
MNVEIGAEAPIFLFWEYLFQIFAHLSLQCSLSIGWNCVDPMYPGGPVLWLLPLSELS